MKILQINNKFNGAGAENVMKTLGEDLSKKRYKVYYATYEKISQDRVFTIRNPVTKIIETVNKIDKPKQKFDKIDEFAITNPNKSLMKNISLNLRSIIPLIDPISNKSMENIVKKIKPDLIHCHNILPSIVPISVAKTHNIPIIVSLHGYWPICPLTNRMQIKTDKICDLKDWCSCNKTCAFPFINVKWYMEKLRNFITENEVYLIPVSNYLKNKLKEYSYPENKIRTIYNGVDTEVFKPSALSIEPKVIHVGRLSYHKGSHIFLKVAKQLTNTYPEIKFRLVGSGLSKLKLKHYNNIEYLERVSSSELINIYSTALCTVVPSIWPEPHPLVPLESMACKTPVIGSKIAGIEESLFDEKTGFLIELFDEKKMIKDISERIIYLYENEKERSKMGLLARDHITENFSLDIMTNRYIETYKNLV